MPQYTGQVDAVGAVGLLEAIRSAEVNTRFYQASTSELFGSTPPPQNEESVFKPRSPYAAAKLMAYWCTVNYREGYGMHATNGILFNHESPRRGETFVTRKITRAVAEIAGGSKKKLFLGNLDAVRDWGYAKEYVESMWLMLQQEKPSDYVVATGVGATVKDFAEASFARVGLNWQDHVEVDQKYIRPTEVDALIGDPSKATKELNWKAKTRWKELAELMIDAELNTLSL
jgi:GDPmannose 4,6-dehydratase